jgi:putative nucleotidyltransferase with HDIG domain
VVQVLGIDSAEILKAVEEVPVLSDSASQLLMLASREDQSLLELEKVVEKDVNLTSQIFKVVNSAAFGLMTPVKTLGRGINYLGVRNVVGLALQMSVGSVYNGRLMGYESEPGELWNHCLQTAIAAREIAKCSKTKLNTDTAYAAGLLHDIGKAVISQFLFGTAQDILASIEHTESVDYLMKEEEITGTNHSKLGFELSKRWNLPQDFAQAILHHHHPDQAPDEFKAIAYIVHLADFVAMMVGSMTSSDAMLYQLDEGYREYIDFDELGLERVMSETCLEFRQIHDSLSSVRD